MVEDDARDLFGFPGCPGLSPPAATAAQASTVAQTPPHCTSPPQPRAAQVGKEEKQQKSSAMAQAHWEHTGNEITD